MEGSRTKTVVDELILSEDPETALSIISKDSALVVEAIERIVAQNNELDDQIKKLQSRQKGFKKLKDGLKKVLTEAVKSTDQKVVETDKFIFRLCDNGGVQPMEIDGEVPDAYQKIVMEPDKKKIRAALDAGEELGFAHFKERGKHLRIEKKEILGYDRDADISEIEW